MSDGITLNVGTGGKEIETKQLANGRHVQILELVTNIEDGESRPVSTVNPLSCTLIIPEE